LTAVRNESITPLQALELLNNPFVIYQSEALAKRLESTPVSLDAKIKHTVELAYGRETSHEEVRALKAYAARHGLANLCRLIFNSNEFLFVN
jgi:hypothetical protein